MTDGGSFYGAPSALGRRRDGLVAVAVVLVVVGIVVAIAKPWGDAGQPAASGPPGVAAVGPSAAASSASALPGSTALPTQLSHRCRSPSRLPRRRDPRRGPASSGSDLRRMTRSGS